MKYLTHNKNYWIIDIEADDLNATRVWCIVLRNIETDEVRTFHGPSMWSVFKEWLTLDPEVVLVGHNILYFDIHTLNRLGHLDISFDRCIDTMVLSYLYHPGMPGGHSLGAWGDRLKCAKGDFNDFSAYSEEMLRYCIQDTAVNRLLYLRLSKRMLDKGFSELSCAIEHGFAVIINEQQERGFFFDIDGAIELRDQLLETQRDLDDQIKRIFPPVLVDVGTYRRRYRSDGSDYQSYDRHLQRYPKVVSDGDVYTVYDWQEFNINSPKQRVDKLLSLGWKPTKFTPKTEKGGGGNPKVDEDTLVEFANESGIAEVQAVADYLVLQGRISMLDGWIRAYNPETGCIHGRVFSCGAGSRRCTHNNPNTANIPKAEDGVKYGKECRALWVARPNRRLVGVYAKSCQARLFGHYINNDDVARRYYDPETYGDPHQVHAEAFGDSSKRSKAKNVFFAFLFGASEKKLKLTWGGKVKGKISQLLKERNPGLDKLTKDISLEWHRNGQRVRCIDGGWVLCPAEHAAINYKIQSAEKVFMALAAILLRRWLIRKNLDAYWVGNIHDEWQIDSHPDCAEVVGQLACRAMEASGRFLKLRVPMGGNYSIGANWAETH